MSVNFTDIVKQGGVRIKHKKLPFWKSRYFILRKASSKGPLHIDSFKDEKSSQLSDGKQKMIQLENVRAVTVLPSDIKRNAIAVVFYNDKSLQIALESDAEVLSWHVALQGTCLPPSRPLTAPSGMDLLCCASDSITQDIYNAYLLPNVSLSMYGECLLQCTTEMLYILDVEDPAKRIIGWPLSALRRYGRDNTKFTFESGRSCPTGEGIFIFNTIYGEKIYKKVHSASLAISHAYRFSGYGENHHRNLMRSATLPPHNIAASASNPFPDDSFDIPQALPPRRGMTLQRQSTLGSKRPLPPLPPTP